jgi:hypothetical protein
MFRRPNDVKAALIGHLDHLQRVARDILHIKAVIHPFKIDSELELHAILRQDPVWLMIEANGGKMCRYFDKV